MHHTGREHLRRQIGHALDRDIAEPVKCKVRHQNLFCPVQDIGIHRSRRPQRIWIKYAVMVQRLCMAHRNFLPLFPLYPDLDQTCQVLSEIHQPVSFRVRKDFLRHNAFGDAHRLIFLRDEHSGVKFRHGNCSLSLRRVVRVNGLTHINLAVPDRSGPNLPVRVRHNDFPTAVLINHMQFRKRRHPVPVAVRLAVETQYPFVPAVSHSHLDTVFAPCFQISCNVICLILQAPVIAGPARAHIILTHPAFVELHLIHPMGSGIENCPFHRLLCHRKAAVKDRARCLLLLEIVCDHLCL